MRLVLTLRMDSEDRPVGTVAPMDAAPVGFEGWLSLMAELHRLASTRPDEG